MALKDTEIKALRPLDKLYRRADGGGLYIDARAKRDDEKAKLLKGDDPARERKRVKLLLRRAPPTANHYVAILEPGKLGEFPLVIVPSHQGRKSPPAIRPV